MNHSTTTPAERYAALVETMLGYPEVTQEGKGFGATSLKVRGKIFAMLASERLVVKLPKVRVDALIASAEGERFDPRRDGRVMKEWFVSAATSWEVWLALAQEAWTFVGDIPADR